MSKELTTEELPEALENWYKNRLKSKLDKWKTAHLLICNPDYKPYNHRECPERMWTEKPITEYNCD